jgi:hypothetical protein
MPPVRALGLLSGGLDSALAARLLIDQGVEVVGLHLQSPTACRADVHAVARELGVRLEVRDKGEAYLRLLREPRHGYGRNMNPCIDCRVFMFGIARGVLEEVGAAFVFTGEVAGQRPMSQGKSTLALIDREAGLEGRVLRPLSARVLPETIPERLGWVDRARLLDLHGRGRVEQLAMARRYGLSQHESPGGGCLLTDARFSVKLKDLFDHSPAERTDVEDVELLRVGRHFRIDPGLKIVLGRSAAENDRLRDLEREDRWLVEPVDFNGPVALVCGPHGEPALDHAARLLAAYSREVPEGRRVRWHEGGRAHVRSLPPPVSPQEDPTACGVDSP